MTAIAIGVLTGGMFVVVISVAIVVILSLLSVLESTLRNHGTEAGRPAEERRSVPSAPGV